MKRKNLWGSILGITYGFLLVAFTVYVVLDTFVIARVYSDPSSPSPGQIANTDGNTPDNSPGTDTEDEPTLPGVFTENSYEDDNISIVLTDYRAYETNIHVAEVTLSSPEYLKTAFAYGAYGLNVKAETSETAAGVNAIFAVNGDYYGARQAGYVLRNGTLYRDTVTDKEDLVIYKDGSFSTFLEKDIPAEQLVSDGAQHILSFGPALVKDGEIAISDKSKVKNPRTAIAWVDENHYLFAVTDGRVNDSEGLTFYELASFMQSLGAKEVYNLDGGGSSAMYFNGMTINKTPKGDERRVSDIVYIGY